MRRVLIVDNDPAWLDTFSRHSGRFGLEPHSAASLQRAVAQLRDYEYHLLIVDADIDDRLDVYGCTDLISELESLHRTTPVLVVTGCDPDRFTLLAAELQGFHQTKIQLLRKPYSLPQFARTIASLLDPTALEFPVSTPQMQAGSNRVATLGPTSEDLQMSPQRTKVFVVHGRNARLQRDFFAFLASLKLEPIDWREAATYPAEGTPYIGTILDRAFSRAHAVIVLLTPDDEVRLAEALWKPDEMDEEKTVCCQPRPNVIFEAGMAFGCKPDRTILVEVGQIKRFSDVLGRYAVRLDNTPARRMELVDRLEAAGCIVRMVGGAFLETGDFSAG